MQNSIYFKNIAIAYVKGSAYRIHFWYTSKFNMKKTGFNGYIYDFSVDYNSVDVNQKKDIQKYLMKKTKWYKKVQIYQENVCFKLI